MRVRGYGTRKCPFEPDSEVEIRRVGKMNAGAGFVLSTSLDGGFLGLQSTGKLEAYDFIHGKVRRSVKFPSINGITGAGDEAWYTTTETPGKLGAIRLTEKKLEVTPCERTLPTTEPIWARLGPDRWLAGRMVINRDLEVVCELPEGFFPVKKLDGFSLDANGHYLALTSPRVNHVDTAYDWQILDLKTGKIVLSLAPSSRELIDISPPWIYTLVRPSVGERRLIPGGIVGHGSVVRHNVQTGAVETVLEFAGSHEYFWGASADQVLGWTFAGIQDTKPRLFSMDACGVRSTIELSVSEWTKLVTSAEIVRSSQDLCVINGRGFFGTSWKAKGGDKTAAFCINDLATLEPIFQAEIEHLTARDWSFEWLCSWPTGIGVECFQELFAIDLKE